MPAPRPRRPRTRRALVGRDAELATLAELLSPAASRRFAVVTGAPGSGCTALLRAVGELAAVPGTTVLTSSAIADAHGPYGTLLAPLLDPAPGSAAYPGIDAASARQLHDLARQAAREPIDCLGALVEGFASAIDDLAGSQPTVLIIDDAQAADAESLRALPLVIRRLTNSRCIIAAHVHGETQLPVRGAVGDLLDNALPGDALQLPLGPLTDADLAALVCQTVGLRPSGQLISSLAHHLGSVAGLPGPTLRLVGALRATGRIRKVDSLDYLADPVEPACLSAEDPLVAALGGVEGDTALVVSVVAALGQAEPQTLLEVADIAGIDSVRLSRRIDQLVDMGLLSLDGRCRFRVAVPALAHTLTGHAVGQADVHQRLADAMLTRGGPDTTQETHRLADHLSLALSAPHAPAQDSSGGGADARDMVTSSVTLAILTRAIRSVDRDVDPLRSRRWGRAISRILTCLSSADTGGGTAPEGATMDALPDVVAQMRRLGHVADAAAIGLQALPLVTGRPAGTALHDAMSVATATALAECGDLARAGRLVAALDVDRLTDDLLAQTARLLTMTGRPEQARHLLARSGSPTHPILMIERVALEAAWGDGCRWEDTWSAWRAAGLRTSAIDGEAIRERGCLGDEDVARTMLTHALGERPDVDSHAAIVTGAWLDGDWDEVLDRAGRLAARSTTAAPPRTMTVARALAAEVWLQRGDPRRSLRWIRGVPTNDPGVPVTAWALAGALYANGESASAEAHLTSTIDGYLRGGRLPGVDLLLARLIEQRLDMQDVAGARHASHQLREVADVLGSRQAKLLTLATQARLDRDPDTADTALALATVAGMRFQRARLHLLCGQLGRDPASHLHEALRLFHTLGAQPWVQQISTMLREHGYSVPRPRGSSSTLTPIESKIADLVAAGLSNRQIAAQLRMSEKTVEGALTRILTKTGCRNRVDLAVRHRPPQRRHH